MYILSILILGGKTI